MHKIAYINKIVQIIFFFFCLFVVRVFFVILFQHFLFLHQGNVFYPWKSKTTSFYTYKHPVPLLYIRLNDHTIQVLIINFCYLDQVYFFFRPYLCLDVLMPYKFWLPVQVFGDLQKNNRKLCLRLSSLLCFNRIRFCFSQKQINKMI